MLVIEPISTVEPEQFDCSRLEKVFNRCFDESYRTRLHGGADEPLYQPAASPDSHHALHYRDDYFASALHEISHWCIAGSERRLQPDFGYWYTPEGRSLDQQRAFEEVEYQPQALEWFFSQACMYHFQLSVDNHALVSLDLSAFKDRVLQQARTWQTAGLPARAGFFFQALCFEYGTAIGAEQLRFELVDLQ